LPVEFGQRLWQDLKNFGYSWLNWVPKFPSLPDWGELVCRGERLDGDDSVRLGDETS
jgi:hypothetical protein